MINLDSDLINIGSDAVNIALNAIIIIMPGTNVDKMNTFSSQVWVLFLLLSFLFPDLSVLMVGSSVKTKKQLSLQGRLEPARERQSV